MKIGDKILQLRKRKEFNREELGKAVGTSGAMIGKYERNEMIPSVEIANKIASALGISLDYLVGNFDVEINSSILDKVLKLQTLPEEDKNTALKLLDAFLRDSKAREVYS